MKFPQYILKALKRGEIIISLDSGICFLIDELIKKKDIESLNNRFMMMDISEHRDQLNLSDDAIEHITWHLRSLRRLDVRNTLRYMKSFEKLDKQLFEK